ncbi:Retrovirus-related Pol polyprotein [Thelohanellus kitauei]|uniref:Retrovirus-related Pol polyprotein n=1 Tax=Thelohanellus kitauei TaxID=669202 RepID=A0A0C2N4K5_THEKT|nr:Retrovirus-related Pol polyprotein [Thelohanellus kitauei]
MHLLSLGFPDPNKAFVISFDASAKAIAAVLEQNVNGKRIPIAFASQILFSKQRKYSTTDKESYAILFGCRKFRPYLYGKKFIITTDHNPLVNLLNMKDPYKRRSTWLEEIEKLDYNIEYVPGIYNIVPDALSRSIAAAKLIPELEMKVEQKKDKLLNDIYDRCRSKQHKNFCIESSLLKRVGRRGHTLVIPSHLRHKVISYFHEKSVSHMGIQKTIDSIRNLFFWAPHERRD